MMVRCRRFFLIVVMFALVFLPALVSQSIAVPDTLVPRDVFVGDQALFSFTPGVLSELVREGEKVLLPQDQLPVSLDMTILSIELSGDQQPVRIHIRFIPWVTGEIKFPSFEIQGQLIEPPSVQIASILERTGKNLPEPSRPPLLLPGTTWFLYALIAVALSMGVFLLFFAFRLLPLLSRTVLHYSAHHRLRGMMRQLKTLDRKIGKMSVDVWYAQLSVLIRIYVSARCGLGLSALRSATTSEITEQLLLYFHGSIAQLLPVSNLRESLCAIDVARFSGTMNKDNQQTCIEQLIETIPLLEALEVEIEESL